MDAKFYEKAGVAPPSVIPHGLTVDDISKRVEPMKAKSWRQEGNMLIAITDWGEVANPIPTDRLLTGVDDNGLPILTKIHP